MSMLVLSLCLLSDLRVRVFHFFVCLFVCLVGDNRRIRIFAFEEEAEGATQGDQGAQEAPQGALCEEEEGGEEEGGLGKWVGVRGCGGVRGCLWVLHFAAFCLLLWQGDLMSELRELAQMKKDGILDDAEFKAAKQKLLGGGVAAAPVESKADPLARVCVCVCVLLLLLNGLVVLVVCVFVC